ncbi:MAG: tRNA-dihydrouridine synthase [Pseudomonadales bacterium]
MTTAKPLKLILAPMESVTDWLLRDLLSSLGGLDRCVTEFVRVTDTLLPKRVFYRYAPELNNGSKTHSGTPVYIQLLGQDPHVMAANAARAASLGAAGIDLNFGCPAKTVNRHCGGAWLLQSPRDIAEIVTAVRAAVPSSVPVTAKMRLGFTDKSLYLDNAHAIADSGANQLCVHARTKLEGYKPPAHWEYIADINEAISIPVVANGDIWSVEDLQRCQSMTGCDHFMLGRGLLAQPYLAGLVQGTRTDASWSQALELLIHFQGLCNEHYVSRHAGDRLKQWLVYMRRQFPQAAVLFHQIKRIREPEELMATLVASRETRHLLAIA